MAKSPEKKEELIEEEVVDTTNVDYSEKIPFKVYFVGAEQFKSKKGDEFNRISAVQLKPDGSGITFTSFVKTMPEICKTLKFGDYIQAIFGIVDLTRKPDLLDITELIKPSPIVTKRN